MSDPSQFNWRNYIRVSEEFLPEQRLLIEQSLDRLAQFHDREGQTLILAAAERAAGPVYIMPGEKNSGTLGRMNLNFETLNNGRYTNDPQGRGPSLLGTMVHEMYHMTDRAEFSESQTISRVMATLYNPDGTTVYIPEFAAIISDENDIFYRLRRGTQQERNEIAEYLEAEYPQNPRLQQYAAMVRSTTAEQWIQRFHEAGATDETGTRYSERRATEYTDALMAKNVGDAEPQRGTYAAMREGEPYPLTAPPPVRQNPQQTMGFDGPGNVDVRPVHAPSESAPGQGAEPSRDPRDLSSALRGIDVNGLNLGSTDGIDRSYAEIGELGRAETIQNDKSNRNTGVGM